MKEPTEKEIKEMHDCSNCRFREDVAPYSVVLGCRLDGKTNLMPHTCDRWENYFAQSDKSDN